MKKIVRGKLYDTNDATAVCSWRETTNVFGLRIETKFTLYREKVAEKPSEGLKLLQWGGVSDWDVRKNDSKGEFFVALQVGDGFDGMGRIDPVGVDEAKRIFEEHAECYMIEDAYEKYFGVRPQKSILSQLKEAFQAGADAKQRQYEEAEAKKKAEAEAEKKAEAEKDDNPF